MRCRFPCGAMSFPMTETTKNPSSQPVTKLESSHTTIPESERPIHVDITCSMADNLTISCAKILQPTNIGDILQELRYCYFILNNGEDYAFVTGLRQKRELTISLYNFFPSTFMQPFSVSVVKESATTLFCTVRSIDTVR